MRSDSSCGGNPPPSSAPRVVADAVGLLVASVAGTSGADRACSCCCTKQTPGHGLRRQSQSACPACERVQGSHRDEPIGFSEKMSAILDLIGEPAAQRAAAWRRTPRVGLNEAVLPWVARLQALEEHLESRSVGYLGHLHLELLALGQLKPEATILAGQRPSGCDLQALTPVPATSAASLLEAPQLPQPSQAAEQPSWRVGGQRVRPWRRRRPCVWVAYPATRVGFATPFTVIPTVSIASRVRK